MDFVVLNKLLSIATGSAMGSSSLAAINNGTESIELEHSFWETFGLILAATLRNILSHAWEMVVNLVYLIGKWALVFIDFIFIFVKQIAGMNTEFESVEEMTESDIIFQFIFNDTVIRVIKGMLGLALILLILFCIIAIFKSEYNYAVNGGGNSKREILVRGMKSLMLMVLVPVISIGGILMSNALLKALSIATTGGAYNTTLGTQIFVSSSYNSNAYRNYADKNLKIPITYNDVSEVTEEDNITSWSVPGGIEDLNQALIEFRNQDIMTKGVTSGWTTLYMIYTEGYLTMSSVDQLDDFYRSQVGSDSPYHYAYDKGLYTKRQEYYVMADVIDYNMKQHNDLYIKTAEEIYESYHSLLEDPSVPQSVKNKLPDYMPIAKCYKDTEGNIVNAESANAKAYYEFTVHFVNDTNPTTYSHKGGETDEAKGAVFLMSFFREEKDDEGNSYSYYYPLLTSEEGFATDYVQRTRQPVIAKGVFENGQNPTAIKQEDDIIKFYRDDMNVPLLTDLFPTISYEAPPEGTTKDLGIEIMKWGVKNLVGVDINQFVPYIYYNFDLFNLFTRKTYDIAKIPNGVMHLNYNFTKGGFGFNNLYKKSEFNVVVFVAAYVLVLGIILKLLFGVTRRVLDITLLAITYPAVLSTMPLDGGGRFSGWVKIFVQKLLSVYGVILGINIVLLLVPTVDNLNLITPNMIAQATQINFLPWTYTAYYANELIELLFTLVLLSSISGLGKTIERIINGSSKDVSDGAISEGETVVNDLKQLPAKVGNIVSGKFIIDTAKGAMDAAFGMIPGAAVVADIQDKVKHHRLKKSMKQDEKDMWNQMHEDNQAKGQGSDSGGKSEGSNGDKEESAKDSGGDEKDKDKGADSSSEAPGGAPSGGGESSAGADGNSSGGDAASEGSEAPKEMSSEGGGASDGSSGDSSSSADGSSGDSSSSADGSSGGSTSSEGTSGSPSDEGSSEE